MNETDKMSINVDYTKYKNNNAFVTDGILRTIKKEESVYDVMVVDLSLENNTIFGLNRSQINDGSFKECIFNKEFRENVFDNVSFVSFVSCTFDCCVDRTKFTSCRFYDCTFCNNIFDCDFNFSIMRGCIFIGSNLHDDLFTAINISNPTFVDCILPEYITRDLVYKTQYGFNNDIVEKHTMVYLFIKAGKLITKDGMIDIKELDDNGLSETDVYAIDKKSILPEEMLRDLIDEYHKKISESVLKDMSMQ